MPLNSIQNLVVTQLDGLAMPDGIPNAIAYVAPPVVEDMAEQPLIFVWGGRLSEKRQTMAGGRSATINTTSGFRTLDWEIDVFIKYAMANDNTDIQNLFPLAIDLVMQKLRGITMPQKITDAVTGWPSQVVLIGEDMEMHYGDIHALSDQRYWLFEAEIICKVREQIQQ
jgi:hypothetical protein